MLLSDYITQTRVLVHDLSKNDWTDSELTTIVNNARQRVGLDLHCVRSFIGGPSVAAGLTAGLINLVTNQEIYPINGAVGGVNITYGGAGYVTAPTLAFNAPFPAPPNFIPPIATATITNGVVTSVTMTQWGSGYQTQPTVSFSASPGNTALGTPVALVNMVDIMSISFLYPGSTNRQTLRWLPFTTFQAWCRMYVGQQGPPSGWTTHAGSNQLYIFPIPDQPYIVELDILTTPTDLVNLTDVDAQIFQPFADCVQYYAAFLARTKLQDYEKADYYRKLYNTRTREVNATRQDFRIPNIYRSSARRMMRW